MGSPGQPGPSPGGHEQTWGHLTPLLLLSCFVLSPQQRRVPGAWTAPCSAESSARRGRVPVGPACPPSRRMTTATVSRSSSHPVVGALTLHPSACTLALHLCSPGRFCASGQPPHPSSTPSSSFSPWQLYLCGDSCSSLSHPTCLSSGGGFGLATPFCSMHPALCVSSSSDCVALSAPWGAQDLQGQE